MPFTSNISRNAAGGTHGRATKIANYVTGKLKPITNSSADGGDSKKGSGPASGGGSGN